ncbi:g9032 [Coccomyxa viridis]|uniref:Translation initiation factor IF-2, chloroplastic n=1 Tax=Coccomyxa viridis TaxID=1274662 RepID=A0ABP1G5Z3_9CHLO
MRGRGASRSLCRRRLLPRAEGGEGGSSAPSLVSKPSLSRPPQRPAPAPPSQEKGSQSQDKPARQGSGGGYKRQNSFQEGSAGNGNDQRPSNRGRGNGRTYGGNSGGRGNYNGQRRPYNDRGSANGQRRQDGADARQGERQMQQPRSEASRNGNREQVGSQTEVSSRPEPKAEASEQAPAADVAPKPQAEPKPESSAAEAEPEIVFNEEQLSQPEAAATESKPQPEQSRAADAAETRPESQEVSAAAAAQARPQPKPESTVRPTAPSAAGQVAPRPQVRNREQPRGGSGMDMRPPPSFESRGQPRASNYSDRRERPQSAPTARAPVSEAPQRAAPESQQQRPAEIPQPVQDEPEPSTSDSSKAETSSAAPAPPTQAPATTFTGAASASQDEGDVPELLSAKPQLNRAPSRGGGTGARGQGVDPRSIPAGARRQGDSDGTQTMRPPRREGQGQATQNGAGPAPANGQRPGRVEYVPVRDTGDDRAGRGGRGGRGGAQMPSWNASTRRGQAQRWQGGEEGKINAAARRGSRAQRRMDRAEAKRDAAPVREEIFEIGVEGMSVTELSQRLALPTGDIVKSLFMKGIMVQVNQVLDKDTVKLVAAEFEVEVLDKEEAGVDTMARKTVDYLQDEDAELLQPRAPIVTVMGHVDHGKTSLLDYIRKAKVAVGEAGGITQAIGAYTVDVPSEDGTRHITFLDTPGHEAFSAMRARGTKVTDIAIVVVAADDGVRPQTLEAISHAKAAEVPILVAINKIDKEGANIERVKQEMSENGLLPEEWGGETPMVAISAKKGDGVDELLETVLLMAEVEELLANPDRPARGTIVESHLDKKTGAIATMLVAAGTLRQGDVVQAGAAYGKVRTMRESRGDVTEARPSIAVQMVGLNTVPIAGDEFCVCSSEQEARKNAEAVELAVRLDRLQQQAGSSMVTTNTLASMDEDDDSALKRFNIILKADATGALEAVKAAIGSLPQDRVQPRFLLAAASDITKSDVDLAFASQGIIVGFNIDPSEAVLAAAKQYGVDMRSYNVIYDIVDDIRALMEGKLASVDERTPIGEGEVRAIFGSGSRIVAGCMITEGMCRKGCHAVIMRGKEKVHEGRVTSLRRVKDDVKEVPAGLECGLAVENYTGWKEGDRIQLCDIKSKQQTLEEARLATPAAAPTPVAV